MRFDTLKMVSLAACMALSIGAHAQPKKAATVANMPASVPKELARVRGELITKDVLSQFAEVVQKAEGPLRESMGTLLEEFVLQKFMDDVYTTIPSEAPSLAEIPTKYKYMNQRRYLQMLLRDKIQGSVQVPRSDIEQWYGKHVQMYQQPERIHARHIFMAVSEDNSSSSPEAVQSRMDAVKSEADKGTSFGLLARKYSEAGSGVTGGDLDWLSYRMPMGPQNKPINIVLDNALFQLKSGQVSDVLHTSHGLHLLYAEERVTTRTPSIEDLTSSGILPGAVANDLITSRIRQSINDSIAKHNGKVLETSGTADLNTTTPAYTFNDKTWTFRDIEQMFGRMFTGAYMRAVQDPEGLPSLMRQVMQDEAFLQAAIDEGLDTSPTVARNLQLLGERAREVKKLQSIIAQDYTAREDEARELYEKQKNKFRRPEMEGFVLIVNPEQTTGTASESKAAMVAQKKIEEALKKVRDGEDFAKLIEQCVKTDRNCTGGLVERHVRGMATTDLTRSFDEVASTLAEGAVSEVRSLGGAFAIATLVKKYEGEPAPFDEVKLQLMREVQFENTYRARQDIFKMVEKKGQLEWLAGAASIRLGSEPEAEE